ncbi:hypothetical protein BO94DRAFT_530880 [Aspergillus sclerotioniger CBS 115572]|uniref:HNH nuclease domain-containing protein n=1 Tax=Aspergillus sclerotioniger CBS 115572 TaxID=1450535 RepID=A0A317XBD7_9EURO|nr:hypothetical protein BO94DRAFT_530880 [Aspergillus sclerotioniger CBS 115572]PWY94992.1 hypothetical protein BO94DRAFT_530880 [Aspergillus sclerotioniger CBS 115572]
MPAVLINGLSLRDTVQRPFDYFAIAFRPTDTPNIYERVLFCNYPTRDRTILPASDRIEFKQAPGAEDLELPSATLLDCHYRLAEIFNASDIDETIHQHLRRLENLKDTAGDELRADGGTDIGEIFKVALWERIP